MHCINFCLHEETVLLAINTIFELHRRETLSWACEHVISNRVFLQRSKKNNLLSLPKNHFFRLDALWKDAPHHINMINA